MCTIQKKGRKLQNQILEAGARTQVRRGRITNLQQKIKIFEYLEKF